MRFHETTRWFLSVLLTMLIAYPYQLYAAGTAEAAEARKLVDLPYSEFFRQIGENYRISDSDFNQVKGQLKQEDDDAHKEPVARISKLKDRQKEIRRERKDVDEKILQAVTKYEQLEERREEREKDGKDASDIVAEQETLHALIDAEREKSNALKQELDGDTIYKFPEAAMRLENLEAEAEESTDAIRKADMERSIVLLKEETERASGINRRIALLERDINLIEAKFSHKLSKLDSLKPWPGELRDIRKRILDGKAAERKFGDVENIGNLEERDFKSFRVFLFLPGMMSPESEMQLGRQLADEVKKQVRLHTDPVITEYVNRLGQNIVLNSDAWCPFTFHVIADPPDKRQVNAFAMPGCQVFVHDSLLLVMESESETAGVLAHEIAHGVSRHVPKQLSKMQYMSIASMAAMYLGALGMLGYQATQIGGGLAMLGISRTSETEADLLGTQYLWNAGYDPRALQGSFDRTLQDEKIGSLSFFQSHPAFPDRMMTVEKEVRFLPPKPSPTVDTSEFHDVQRAVRRERMRILVDPERVAEEENQPKLKRPGENGAEPETPDLPPVLRRQENP